jgi:hypothetical protein
VEQRRPLHRERDARRRGDHNRVREAESELEVRTLGDHAVTGAGDLQALTVALGDADDHVGDQRAGQAVQFLGPALVVRAHDVDDAAVAVLGGDRLGKLVRELALRALDSDGRAVDLHLDAARHRDRLTSDSRHWRPSSPDEGEDFPAHPSFAGLPVGEQPL